MVEKATHVFDRLPRVPPELRGRVPEDMDAGEREPCCLEVAPEVGVERAAGDAEALLGPASVICGPQRLAGFHRCQALAPRIEGRDDRIESRTRQLSLGVLPALASVRVVDRVPVLADVLALQAQHFRAPPAT